MCSALSVSKIIGLCCRGDCGVYALKHIELRMRGMENLDYVSDNFVDAFRMKMAHSVWSNKWVT